MKKTIRTPVKAEKEEEDGKIERTKELGRERKNLSIIGDRSVHTSSPIRIYRIAILSCLVIRRMCNNQRSLSI